MSLDFLRLRPATAEESLTKAWNLLLGYGRVYTESPSIPGHPDSAGLVQITTQSSSSFCCLWAAPGLSQPRKFLP